MKKVVFLLLEGWSVSASAKQMSEALKLQSATVYLSGAQLVNTARVNLEPGDNEIVLTHVATGVNEQSMTVNASNDATILSAEVKKNYLVDDTLRPRLQLLKDSIEEVTSEKKALGEKIATCKMQIAILDSNKKVGGVNSGLSVAELQKLLDLVTAKYEGILHQKNVLEAKWAKVDEHLSKLQKQLADERKKGSSDVSDIVLKLTSPKGGLSTILITYYVTNAGWSPVYDFSTDDITKPSSLVYKAKIRQTTGIDWDNVKLRLSTDNPREGIQAPVLNPWYLAFTNPIVVRSYKKSLVGDANHAMALSAAPAAKEDEVAMVGARAEGQQYVIDGVQVESNGTLGNSVEVDNSGTDMVFDIDIPYTIAADGHEQLVAVKQFSMPAIYRYYTVPKLDKDVFLQARISDWENLGLLPGPCNTFFEGTYVGQSYLNFAATRDTLDISLGRDKHLFVHREKDRSFRSVKTIGSNVSEEVVYTIVAKNTRKNAIDLIVEDQIPVSTDKDIVVDDIDTGNSIFDPAKGKMTWPLHLNTGEAKNLRFSYTVRYPKSKKINN